MFSLFRRKKDETSDESATDEVLQDYGSSPSAVTSQAALARIDDNELFTAVEAVVGILRSMGQHAFAIDERTVAQITNLFEGWCRHLLTLHSPPGFDETAAAVEPAGRRHWGDLLGFVRQHRQAEAGFVQRTTTSLRDAIWQVLQCFDQTLAEDRDGTRAIQDELDRLRETAERGSPEQLQEQALSTARKLSSLIAERQESLRRHSEGLADRLSNLDRELQIVKQESSLDPLTRLYNRRATELELDRAITLRHMTGRRAGLILVDVDHFKRVNDTYGHPGGDEVLRRIANCLVRCFPRRTDLVGRYGGEEFCVVLAEVTLEDLSTLAERLVSAIRSLRIDLDGVIASVSASAGYALLEDGEDRAHWIERADRALYAAKLGGRDRAEAASIYAQLAPPQQASA